MIILKSFINSFKISLLLINLSIAATELSLSSKSAGFKEKKAKSHNQLLQRTDLYYSPECQDEIRQYCPRAAKVELNNMAVLQCIHNEVKSLDMLSKPCHTFLYAVKKNFTINLQINHWSSKVCENDLVNLPECTKESSKTLASCLLDNKKKIVETKCRNFIHRMAALIFSDYRLIYGFHEECHNDIVQFECGRLDDSQAAPTQQGKTIECLSKHASKLTNSCKKQIYRIGELQADDFHLDRALYFACREDRERFCELVASGEGKVYKCLEMKKFEPEMSNECRVQLTRRQMMNFDNVKTDESFHKACLNDMLANHCVGNSETTSSFENLSNILLCLENAEKIGTKISPKCKAEMMDHRRMLMQDYRLSPHIVKHCAGEIKEFCAGGIELNGKTLYCLISAAKNSLGKFKPECFVELKNFMKVVNPAENIKVDPNLYISCQNLIEDGVCKNLQAGHGHLIECLTRQLNSENMREECHERLLGIQFFVARDWTLDEQFYSACRGDSIRFCNAPKDWYDKTNLVQAKSIVLPCLYHHTSDNLESSSENIDKYVSKNCAIEIRNVMLKRAQSIDLMPEIQDSCGFELAKMCSDPIKTKKGEEIKCLQDNFNNLESHCKEQVRLLIQNQNNDIRLDQILFKSCLPTIDKFCSDKREEKGQLLKCLIQQKNNPSMSEKCRAGIEHHQILNLNDITLNMNFVRKCRGEIDQHCGDKKSKNEVIYCLSEIVLNDTLLNSQHRIGPPCRDQLRFEWLETNQNIKLDPLLSRACSADITQFCSIIAPGQGGVVECLRTNEIQLSSKCKKVLSKREKLGLIDENSDYALKKNCRRAIEMFCHVDSDIGIVDCLRQHLLKQSLGQLCRQTVINRIVSQNKDARLNPKLWNSCLPDITMRCKDSFVSLKNAKEDFNGKVLKCLRAFYVRNMLSKFCQIEVSEVMREAANVDFRLDPSLADGCLNELEVLCTNEPNDKKENCLRLKFQHRLISKESKCYEEVKRIIIEGAADVFVDHDLSQLCEQDLAKFCGDIAPGSAQHLKCLMGARESQKNKFSERCADALDSRRQLWQMARIGEEMVGLNDLAHMINVSHSRTYLFSSLMLIFFMIFMLGFICRPALIRRRSDKLK